MRQLIQRITMMVCAAIFGTSAVASAQENNKKRPFVEYEEVGALAISAKPYYGGELQSKILANLPEGLTVIMYSQDQEDLTFAKEMWGEMYKKIDIRYVLMPASARTQKGISYFAMDSMPYPVMVGEHYALMDVPYRAGFEPDSVIASITGMPLNKFPYAFEFGNFMSNDAGLCFIINNSKEKLFSDEEFNHAFGCQKLVRLPRLKAKNSESKMVEKGLGHIDERVKFIRRDTVLTDSNDYKTILEEAGLKVIMVPEASTPHNLFRTYINGRLINGTAFVPAYNIASDKVAQEIYRQQGFKVVPVASADMSDFGHGSVHCATATYPQLPEGMKFNFYTN